MTKKEFTKMKFARIKELYSIASDNMTEANKERGWRKLPSLSRAAVAMEQIKIVAGSQYEDGQVCLAQSISIVTGDGE